MPTELAQPPLANVDPWLMQVAKALVASRDLVRRRARRESRAMSQRLDHRAPRQATLVLDTRCKIKEIT